MIILLLLLLVMDSSANPAVKISVANQNWVDTITICNISNAPIPLTNLEFDFNLAKPMPTNIWGNPWVAWQLVSQNGNAVVLKGGTSYATALQSDPKCANPLTIQFNAAPTDPMPTGPFNFIIPNTPVPPVPPVPPQPPVPPVPPTPPAIGSYTTLNGNIIDATGKIVAFKGVNWFGFNNGNHVVNGLWSSDFDTMLGQIKSLGFNAVRLPFSFDFIFDQTIKPNGISTYCGSTPCNADVPQDSALHTFQWVVQQFTNNGIYVLVDDHYEDDTYVTNQSAWIKGWQQVALMFKSNPMLGYDLYNEPDSHSLTWDGNANGTPLSTGYMNAIQAIYAIDPNKLIFVEGTAQNALGSNWGDGYATDNATVAQGISNPKNFFTQLMGQPYIKQIVIAPHMYGPDGTNNGGPDHSNPNVAFPAWAKLHGYLLNNYSQVNNTNQSGFCLNGQCHVFPIAVGEFGGLFSTSDPYYTQDVATQINIANFMNKLSPNPSWFYWDWNPNSGNTGGILENDWKTIDCNKVNYLKQYLGLKPATGICS